jgi:hypothetical protein
MFAIFAIFAKFEGFRLRSFTRYQDDHDGTLRPVPFVAWTTSLGFRAG